MHESGFGRLGAALMAPGKTFRAIAERPTWVAPFVVLVLLSGVLSVLVMQRMDIGEMIRARVEESGREVPAEAVEQQVEMMERFGWVFGLLGVVATALMYV